MDSWAPGSAAASGVVDLCVLKEQLRYYSICLSLFGLCLALHSA